MTTFIRPSGQQAGGWVITTSFDLARRDVALSLLTYVVYSCDKSIRND